MLAPRVSPREPISVDPAVKHPFQANKDATAKFAVCRFAEQLKRGTLLTPQLSNGSLIFTLKSSIFRSKVCDAQTIFAINRVEMLPYKTGPFLACKFHRK